MLFHGCSLLFIVQAYVHCSPNHCFSFHKIRQNIVVYVNCKRIIQKYWSILNLVHLLTSYLFKKKNSGVAGGFKIMYLPSICFYNSQNSHNLSQIKIYHYPNSSLKKKQKLFSPLAFSKSEESIISTTCFSSIFPSHFFHLCFIRAG